MAHINTVMIAMNAEVVIYEGMFWMEMLDPMVIRRQREPTSFLRLTIRLPLMALRDPAVGVQAWTMLVEQVINPIPAS
jgi:hypothetical protein